jgi:hypothetical protein
LSEASLIVIFYKGFVNDYCRYSLQNRRIFMRLRTILVSLAVLFVFFLCQISTAGQKLRYNYEKGKTYKYSTVVESKTSGQAMGQEFTITSGADFDYSISLISANAGVMTLMVKYEKFNIKLNMPIMGFNDSTIVMQEYVGKRVKIVETDKGKTLSVEPIDTIPPSREQMMASLNPKDLFKQILLELPEKELDVNGSWKNVVPDTITRSGMKMVTKQNLDFKVVAAEKKNDFNCWKITITGTNTIEGSGNQRGADVTIDGTVKINGTAYIAPAEGVFVLADQSNETEMTTTVTGSQTGASTMSISTIVKTTLIK